MIYRVRVTATAKRDAQAAYPWLKKRTPTHAATWFNGLVEAVENLSIFPTRWALAKESSHFQEDIRQLLYGNKPYVYRGLFIIRDKTVYVLHIRHGARRTMTDAEFVWPE